MTADDRIILIRVKIERAKKHFRDLENELATFGNKNFYATTTDMDAQTGQITKKEGLNRIRPFDALAAAGDIVHNLRSALDHLANQLVWVGSGKEPSRRVEFPIAKDAATYEREKTGKVEGMSLKVIEAIDALNPYKSGDDTLWRIHELDNIDKHRTLFTYSRDCFLVADWLPKGPFNLKASNPNFTGVEAFDNEVEEQMEFEIDKAISEPKGSSSDAILPSLLQFIEYVDHLILSFKPFLQ